MLWNRSLVMVDKETRSLWSHLLGRAMKGKLKGTQLTAIPATMTTWKAWHREHPGTTVINLARTAKHYVKAFYRNPKNFVYGWIENGQAYDANFDMLLENTIVNLPRKNASLLLTFDGDSTAVNLFSADVEGEPLHFTTFAPGRMQDTKTNSVWNSHTGVAIEGPMKDTQLKQRAGIVSYVRVWNIFHPESRSVQATN